MCHGARRCFVCVITVSVSVLGWTRPRYKNLRSRVRKKSYVIQKQSVKHIDVFLAVTLVVTLAASNRRYCHFDEKLCLRISADVSTDLSLKHMNRTLYKKLVHLLWDYHTVSYTLPAIPTYCSILLCLQ